MTTVGIVGGGQLARMLALAGYPLGLRFVVLDPAPDACAAQIADHIRGAFDNEQALARLAAQADLATLEFENVPAASVHYLARRIPVYPPVEALEATQDRLREKRLFCELGIPTATFFPVDSRADLEVAVSQLGLPVVCKTRSLGYDGKGQAVLRSGADLAPAWERLGGAAGAALIAESYVPFDRELSIIAVRGCNGETAYYPVAENTHRDGILRLSLSRPGDSMQAQAEDCIARLLDALDYVGVLALELFEVKARLLANEYAPRVHNSGHWTIEGAETSQFENHLRAILGVPLGDTAALGYAAMVNFIGTVPERAQAFAAPRAHLHLYDKQPRPGRKLGHVTLRSADAAALDADLRELLAALWEGADPELQPRVHDAHQRLATLQERNR